MKSIIFSVLSVLAISSVSKANQYLDLDRNSVEVATFVAKCAAKFEGKNIVSGIKGTFEQGIQMNFTTDKGEVISVQWDRASNLYSCK